MSNVIALNTKLDMWTNEEKLKEIRRLISPSTPLTDIEFSYMVELGKATQLNPFMKEIWAVKYSHKSPAQIFIGRDGYRKTAQRQPDYEYHQVNAVYSKDEFKIMNDEIQHSYGFSNRGDLLGAYCIVKRKSASKYMYIMVTMDEYNLKQGLWTNKPETMIKKVAEAQAMRQAFQEVLSGTYSDAELPQEVSPKLHLIGISEGQTNTEKLNALLNHNAIEAKNEQVAHDEQIRIINELFEQKQLSQERIDKAFSLYEIESLDQLTYEQARRFILQLERI